MENGGVFNHKELIYGFSYKSTRITLMGAAGIWFPKGFSIPISITTTTDSPYNDGLSEEGFLKYRYRGSDPNHRDNLGLRKAYKNITPLIYFYSIKPGKYVAIWPIFIFEDDPGRLVVRAAIDPAYPSIQKGIPTYDNFNVNSTESDIGVRKYITAIIKQRLHQSTFREYVLDAYSRQCAMCRLRHEELLDAAHIIPDSDDWGEPVINNGISLCKIHHAAYDRNVIGINPDYFIKVREDILSEIDGPMLRYGFQSLEGEKIILPNRVTDYPDKERLARRYGEFIA